MICQIATVRFPPAIYKKMKEAAASSHTSVNTVIVKACEAFIEKKEVKDDSDR